MMLRGIGGRLNDFHVSGLLAHDYEKRIFIDGFNGVLQSRGVRIQCYYIKS